MVQTTSYRKIIEYSFIIAVVMRFLYFNYMNWKYGYFSTGIPGIQYWVDSHRYIEGAQDLIDGSPIIGRANQYLGYIGFLSLISLLGFTLEFAVVFQIAMALVSALALYQLTKSITNNKMGAYLTFALYLLNPFISTWHTFILTESLYSSFVILTCWSLYKALSVKSFKYILLCTGIVLITLFLRPNGWVFLPVVIFFVLFYQNIKLKVKITIAALIFLSLITVALITPAVDEAVATISPVELLKNGEVVWGHDEERMKMPETSELSDGSQVLTYIIKHPLSCIKLVGLRIGKYFIQIRAHHSTAYKTHVFLWIIPAYILALIGALKFRKSMIVHMVILVILGHTAIVALTHVTHESRFLIYILPLIYLLSGCGLVWFLQKAKNIKLLSSVIERKD